MEPMLDGSVPIFCILDMHTISSCQTFQGALERMT